VDCSGSHSGSEETGPIMNLRKRPRDPAQLAKLMIDIATGDVEAASVGTLVNVSPQIPYKWPAA